MFIPDGSRFDYHTRKENPKLFAWGWLSQETPDTDNQWGSNEEKHNFLRALKKIPVSGPRCKGFHTCDFSGCWQDLGQGVKVIQYQGKSYQAPAQVAHYIEEHGYCPPLQVIDAVLNGKPFEGRFVR